MIGLAADRQVWSAFKTSALASWVYPLLVGLGATAVIAGLVLVLHLVPALALGYPFALTPLFAVGPMAVRDAPTSRRALSRATLAGAVAAVGTISVFVLATRVLGDYEWTFVWPFSAPPFPSLPQPSFIPLLSWPQHYVLALIAVLTTLHGWIAYLLRDPRLDPLTVFEQRLAAVRASLQTKLSLTFLVLATLTMATGWLGFSALEDSHDTGHRRQFQMIWLDQLTEMEEVLSQLEHDVLVPNGDPSTVVQRVGRVQTSIQSMTAALRTGTVAENGYTSTGSASPYGTYQGDEARDDASHSTVKPAIFFAPSERQAFAATYAANLDAIDQRIAHLQLPPTSAADAQSQTLAQQGAIREARMAVLDLRHRLEHDIAAEVDRADLSHHTTLVAMLGLVCAATLTGLVFGRVAAAAITTPIQTISDHLVRVARADFGAHVRVHNADELGRLAGVLNWMTSELERLYRGERQAREVAESLAQRERELSRTREFWAHTIVHDLRNPLSVIASYVELLQTDRFGALSPTQRQMLAEMEDRTNQVIGLVADIVDLFRLEQANLPLDTEPEDPAELLALAERNHSLNGLHPIAVTVETDLPRVVADRRLLLRVLGNLIANAFKHAGPQARIALSAQRRDGEVRFTVDDDGPGVPVAERERVFEWFVRSEHSSGSGMGLAFCKLVIERHGGRIWIEDAPDGGARFVFTLPVATTVSPSVVVANAPTPPQACRATS